VNKAVLLSCLLSIPEAVNASGSAAEYLKALKVLSEVDSRPAVANVASGFGASSGQYFASVSYTDQDTQTMLEGDDDGSIILGFGLGNPQENFGLELVMGITSVSTSMWGDGKFGDEGNLNVKIHRSITPIWSGQAASVSLGASNFYGWGSTVENPVNTYLAYSEIDYIGNYSQYGLAYTIGYGSAVASGETSSSFFGGVGIARSHYGASISFVDEALHYSMMWYPPFLENLSVTLSHENNRDIQNSGRNILTIGYSFQVKDE